MAKSPVPVLSLFATCHLLLVTCFAQEEHIYQKKLM